MRKRWLNIILFLLFIIEGTVFRYLSPDYYGYRLYIEPRLILAFIISISIYRDRTYGLFLGLAFGILYDISYGNVIGIYMIAMAAIGYFSGWLIQFFHSTFLVYSIIEIIGFFTLDLFVYSMKLLFHLTDKPFMWSMFHIIIPTIIFNYILISIIYYPLLKIIQKEE